MRMIAWLMTIGLGFAGIALREQGGFAVAQSIGTGLLILAGLACPLFWAKDVGIFDRLGATRRDRMMFGLALMLATPLILPWS
jgi:hypothetical protein